ncbi:abortive phage infection protein [Bacillus sp. 165]|uniref:abortive phage infection protein n=1 Tax=Bacillus sp. 165 TaxID=1529117 RepID=UPI001ADA0E69|nr:abortive phage infection protein [Bacillus sp. 165]MBO9128432.1 abortive phage infection protein [Bacillus sp. 165]
MDKQTANAILDQLKTGELKEYIVNKEDFYPFREVVVSRADFKHFRGIAEHGGKVIYTYTEAARS